MHLASRSRHVVMTVTPARLSAATATAAGSALSQKSLTNDLETISISSRPTVTVTLFTLTPDSKHLPASPSVLYCFYPLPYTVYLAETTKSSRTENVNKTNG